MQLHWLRSCALLGITGLLAACQGEFGGLSQQRATRTDYQVRHNALTTQFYVGEDDVLQSAFNSVWFDTFGGIDHPLYRQPNNVYLPALPAVNENPFYFSLPYSDLSSDKGIPRANRVKIPWYDPKSKKRSQIKNRWIKVMYKGNTCYAQWEDCGPVNDSHRECDDFEYVFGNSAQPNNDQYALDISPAMSYCLGMRGEGNRHRNDITSWQFVDFKDVPEGPWKERITISDVYWRPH